MKNTAEFLLEVKAKHHLTSDGQLAKMLGLTRASVSVFMLGKNFLGDETAMHVAELLEIDPAYVVTCVHAERAKQAPEREMWARMASIMEKNEFAGIAAVLVVLILLPLDNLSRDKYNVAFAALPSQAAETGILYIM